MDAVDHGIGALGEAAREAALEIREAFIPELALLGASYATEAANALGKRERMPAHKHAFSLLPVPGKKTIRAWVDGFVSRGEALDALLRARAEQVAATAGDRNRAEAGMLRIETIGLLGRLRAALADEMAAEAERLGSLDAELFGYIDQLAADREASLRRRGVAEPEPVAPTDAEAAAVA